MTVTWIDTAGSLLDTRSEPIDFTVSSPVVAAISVSFGVGVPEERVYRDGVFLFPYLESEKNESTFTLRRVGGWPAPPSVFVDEAATVPTAAQALRTLYEVDFTAQPDQLLADSGPHTIDGKRWNAKGSTSISWVTLESAVVAGTGLRISANGSIAYSATGDYSPRFLTFPLAQLPDFDPAAPIAILAHMTTATDGRSSGYVGLISTSDDGVAFLSTDRSSQIFVGTVACSISSGANHMYAFGGSDDALQSAAHQVPYHYSIGARTVGLFRTTRRAALSTNYPWTGALPADPMDAQSGFGIARGLTDPTSHHVAFFGRSQVGQPWDVSLTHLRIMQPRLS